MQVIATPAVLGFFDRAAIEKQTGNPVKSQYSKPGTRRSQIPDAIIVAPATYNTINKWALGISDTYALGVLAENTGMGTPIIVLPFFNTALAGRARFISHVESLRAEGARILLGGNGIKPHPPRTGGRPGQRIVVLRWVPVHPATVGPGKAEETRPRGSRSFVQWGFWRALRDWRLSCWGSVALKSQGFSVPGRQSIA